MRKVKVLLTTALMSLLAFCMFAFVGCGSNSSEIAGSYKLQSLSFNGETYQLGQEADGALVTEDTVTVQLSEDGTMVLVMNAMSKDGAILNRETMTGNWKETDDGLSFTFGKYVATGSYDDGCLTISIPAAATYVLVKE